MTDLVDLLTAIRTHYVGMYEAALEELRQKGHRLIIEPPMLNEAGELAREGALNLGARYDLAIQEGENATPSMFSPSRMLQFEPASFEGGGLSIVLAPFQWDNVRMAIDGDPAAIAGALTDWFEQAIAAPDSVKEDGLQLAAHFLSDPVVAGGASLVMADLGTVEVHVLIELFDRLRDAGVSRIELGLADAGPQG